MIWLKSAQVSGRCQSKSSIKSDSEQMAGGRGDVPIGMARRFDHSPVEWRVSDAAVPYQVAIAVMDARARAIATGHARELVWLLEHPPLYTAGTSAKPTDLIDARFPVFKSGRGGQFTYHGPGQRVVYLMLDLRRRTPDVRRFVATLEEWLIRTLRTFGVHGVRREDRVGVWVHRPGHNPECEDKIAALGIRVRHFVTMHGISLNVDPVLGHFAGIVPCGIANRFQGVTSLAQLGLRIDMPEIDAALRIQFEPLFGSLEALAGDPAELLHSAIAATCGVR